MAAASRPTEHRSHDDDANLMRRPATSRAPGWTPRRPLAALPGRRPGVSARLLVASSCSRCSSGSPGRRQCARRPALRRGGAPEGARDPGEAAARAGGEDPGAAGRPGPGDRVDPDRARRDQHEPRRDQGPGSRRSRRRSPRVRAVYGDLVAQVEPPRPAGRGDRAGAGREGGQSCASARPCWPRACARPTGPSGRRSSRPSCRPARSRISCRTWLLSGPRGAGPGLAGRIEARCADPGRPARAPARHALGPGGAARRRRWPRSASSTPGSRS